MTRLKRRSDSFPPCSRKFPTATLELEWQLYKKVQFEEGPVPNKYRELIGVAVSAVTKCEASTFYHTEMAKLHGATPEEIEDAVHFAKSSIGWGTYIDGLQLDLDQWKDEIRQLCEHVRSTQAADAVAAASAQLVGSDAVRRSLFMLLRAHYEPGPSASTRVPVAFSDVKPTPRSADREARRDECRLRQERATGVPTLRSPLCRNWVMKNMTWASVPLAVALIGILVFLSLTQTSEPPASPAAHAESHGNESNVDLREHVDDVFARADACACQQKIDEAITLYEQGLQVDPWRLEYQLKLARLLKQIGLEEQAVEKAQVVRRYTEQQGPDGRRGRTDPQLRIRRGMTMNRRPLCRTPHRWRSSCPHRGGRFEIALGVAASAAVATRDQVHGRREPLTLGGMDRTYAAMS